MDKTEIDKIFRKGIDGFEKMDIEELNLIQNKLKIEMEQYQTEEFKDKLFFSSFKPYSECTPIEILVY